MVERPILFSAPMVRAILAGTKTQTRRIITDRNSRGNFRSSELLLDDPRTFSDPGPSPAGNPGHYLHAYVNAPLIEKRKGWKPGDCDPTIMERLYPLVFPGDRLWLREAFAFTDAHEPRYEGSIEYRADNKCLAVSCNELFDVPHGCDPRPFDGPWTPSIHMPRWASRITLEVTGVRVERLQDISEADALAEGITYGPTCDEEGRSGGFHWDRTSENETVWPSASAAYRRLWESINGPGSWDANPWVWCVEFSPPGSQKLDGGQKG